MHVHSGHLEAAEIMRADLKNAILAADGRAARPSTPIVLTGHSLGGALAQVAAVRLLLDNDLRHLRERIYVVTFGAPMVFCSAGPIRHHAWSSFADRFHHVLNLGDVVPMLPVRECAGPRELQYRRLGIEHRLGAQHQNLGNMVEDTLIYLCKSVATGLLAQSMALAARQLQAIREKLADLTGLCDLAAGMHGLTRDRFVTGHLLTGERGYIRAVNQLHRHAHTRTLPWAYTRVRLDDMPDD
jgi:alpha-beta hydrolase superfamily lysophospholipase